MSDVCPETGSRKIYALLVQSIIRSYREAGQLAVAKVRELSIDIATDDAAKRRDMLVKCAMTSMNSKLVRIYGFRVYVWM